MIVPSLNPDGREIAQERGCTSKIGQTNAHGRDLDTDFTSKAAAPWLGGVIGLQGLPVKKAVLQAAQLLGSFQSLDPLYRQQFAVSYVQETKQNYLGIGEVG